jgi:hypothetical protein
MWGRPGRPETLASTGIPALRGSPDVARLGTIWLGLGTRKPPVPKRFPVGRCPGVGPWSRAWRRSIARYPRSTMATRKINLTLDEELVRRARQQDTGEADKSDVQVVEDALAVFLGLRALEDARAQGTLAADEADRLAVQEVRAVRQARRRAA